MVTGTTDVRPPGGARPPWFIPGSAVALAAAFALGVAIIVLAEGSPSRGGSRPEAPGASPAIPAGATTASTAERTAVYLVSSAEEAVEFRRDLAALTPGGYSGDVSVLAAGSPDETAGARAALRDLELDFGVGRVRVVDLRRPGMAPMLAGAPPCDVTPSEGTAIGAC